MTLQGSLWKTIVVKSSPLVISTTESRLSASFPNRMSINNGSDANLLEVTTKVEEGSMSESYGGMTSRTSKSATRCSLKLQQASIQFKQHETIAILEHNKVFFLHQKDRRYQQGSAQLSQLYTRVNHWRVEAA
ncbi:hypothetical protein B296_00037571 [Ensete ventricosum]|uniref:Uncharacterized protein n=1 Tax=Ensete ventricosum TaxID=4639 RepID=A0A426Z5T9_ENSVE|nr:hypothetical protein B296_00037571 [Ensete ventricosum]